ncbi:glycosyltransferase family 2 protein [Methanolobus halotolerans]|uniref:Glycosyl transferase family 2 n=1 Tax=Methanolobus halotolerans TaxID=2052935 RepID=A0A4E0Q9A9_9EURY|nr:hypothetical protein [Methanolobus halotolerans]TGC08727.1 hypothetical protein CUN85_08640 [Methanolobus halotolerans]
MELTMVIPSYWGRDSSTGWQEGDAVYDHPIPIDEEGTLDRAIRSIGVLDDKDFSLVVLAVATSPDIENEVEKKVTEIVAQAASDAGVKAMVFGPSHLKEIHKMMDQDGKGEYADLLQLRGYSNVRNMCLFIPHILGADAAVLIDDDEVFEDTGFIGKVREHIGQEVDGKKIYGLAGYYLQPDDDFYVPVPEDAWARYWGKQEQMNKAFESTIASPPRIKETPFVFGGNMTIHRELFSKIPFDPNVRRGEDIDYIMNAMMFGYKFFLDNELHIKHLPPEKSHPQWKRLREDIYRFVFEREKLRHQKGKEGMKQLSAEDFGEYPGAFFKDDLDDRIMNACMLLSAEYRRNGDIQGGVETLQNIPISKNDAVPSFNPFGHLIELQKKWEQLMDYTTDEKVREKYQAIIGKKR